MLFRSIRDNKIFGNGILKWVGNTSYALNSIISNEGNYYIAKTAGTSSGAPNVVYPTATPPTGTGTSISDGTVKWDYLGVDEGPNYFVYFNSEANRTSVIGNRFSTFPAGAAINGWIYIDPSAQDIYEYENNYNGNDPTWQPAHAYSLGDRVSSSNAVYVVSTAGTKIGRAHV